MALSTSPGFETRDQSIFCFGSLSTAFGAPAPFLPPVRWKCWRTRSASSSSSELECVFFSVTPTCVRASRIALLFTSSSRAKSLIRTLLIRPFVSYPTPFRFSSASSRPRELHVILLSSETENVHHPTAPEAMIYSVFCLNAALVNLSVLLAFLAYFFDAALIHCFRTGHLVVGHMAGKHFACIFPAWFFGNRSDFIQIGT